MTGNELIKALEEHIERTKNIKYGARKMVTVDVELLKDALDIINRQKANAEGLTNAVKYLNEKVSSARVETAREFAKRLKDEIKDTRFAYEAEEQCECIDNLLKKWECEG